MVSRRTRRHKQRSWLLYRFLSGPMMDPSCRHARRNRGDDHLLPAITRDSRNDCCEDDDPCKSVPRPNVLARAKIKKIDDVPGSTVLHTLASHTKGALQQSFSVLCRQTSPFTFWHFAACMAGKSHVSRQFQLSVSKATVDNNKDKFHKNSRFSKK